MKRRVVIGGSTGSIGTKALSIIEENPEKFQVMGLIAHSNNSLFRMQVERFKPRFYIFGEALEFDIPKINQLSGDSRSDIFSQCDIFLNGISGVDGLYYTLKALETDACIALANKESVILGSKLMFHKDPDYIKRIVPVDSEHSSLFQLLEGRDKSDVDKLIITASGGIVRNKPFGTLSPVQILDHPNWSMGPVITVDSSTMVNKAYEVIEAHVLFGVPLDNIEVLFHPQSAIHGMVGFKDGNTILHYSPTDMYFPIRYALHYPAREAVRKRGDIPREFIFERVNYELYPNFHLFVSVLKKFDRSGAALIYSNQSAVSAFLKKKIPFNSIYDVNLHVSTRFKDTGELQLEDLHIIKKKVGTMVERYLGGQQ